MGRNITNVSRRGLMKMGAGALLAGGLWPGVLAAQDAMQGENFSFIQVNDLHYIDKGCVPFFKKMIEKMKTAAPEARLLLVVGDTCENGTPVQLNAIRDIVKTLDIPTKVVIGNHDWTSDTDRKAYEQAWPDSLNYTFDHGGWQFVSLDSSDGTKWQNTQVLKPTFDWLDQNLPKLDRMRPMVLVTHFPLGAAVTYRVTNADDLLDRFRDYNLRGVFNGHFHGFTERKKGSFTITTDRCCSFRRNNHDKTLEKGFFVCKVKDGTLTRDFIEVSREQAPA